MRVGYLANNHDLRTTAQTLFGNFVDCMQGPRSPNKEQHPKLPAQAIPGRSPALASCRLLRNMGQKKQIGSAVYASWKLLALVQDCVQ